MSTQELDPLAVVNPDLFESSAEQNLMNALLGLVPQTEAAKETRNYQLLIDGLVKVAPIVSEFFDGDNSVLVMAEDEAVKRNRLNLVRLIEESRQSFSRFWRDCKITKY